MLETLENTDVIKLIASKRSNGSDGNDQNDPTYTIDSPTEINREYLKGYNGFLLEKTRDDVINNRFYEALH